MATDGASGETESNHGAFDDFEAVSMGGNGLDAHDLEGHESPSE